MKKIMIASGLILLLGGSLGGYFLGKNQASNQAELSEKTEIVTETSDEKTSTNPIKTEEEMENTPIALSEEETQAIDYKKEVDRITKTMDAFIDAYDNSSTETYQSKMNDVFPMMTARAQEYVSPYFEDDKNMVKIESELDYVHHYVKYSPGRDYATVLSLLETKVRFNGEKTVYGQRILTKCELVLEDDTWKVDKRATKNFTDNDPRTFFE